MNVQCPECHVFHFQDEQASNGHFGTCCNGGKVQIPLLCDPPRMLSGLCEGDDAAAKEFRANITQYNAAVAFTSLGVNPESTIARINTIDLLTADLCQRHRLQLVLLIFLFTHNVTTKGISVRHQASS